MKTAAIAVSRFRVASRSDLAARLPDYITLMKPRVIALAVFTALVGLMLATVRPDPLLGFIAILAIAGGGAGVLNMWFEADIDALMIRTARRPIPRGVVSRAEALVFGLALSASSVVALALAANPTAAAARALEICSDFEQFAKLHWFHAGFALTIAIATRFTARFAGGVAAPR